MTNRKKKWRFAKVLPICLFAIFINPQISYSEFYKYVDKDGKIHYVDSKTKIPREYRKDLTTYQEKYDHLSDEEREKKIEEDRKKLDEQYNKRKEQLQIRKIELEERRRKEEDAEEERLKKQRAENQIKARLEQRQKDSDNLVHDFETTIDVVGYGQALVPCTLVFGKYEVEAKLLLDTGCSITTIYEDTAKQLHLKSRRTFTAQAAGGTKVKNKLAKLSYIKVGPYRQDDFHVGIIKYKGKKSPQEGLLGMNFLVGRDYKIDYVREVIRWGP